MNFVIVEINNSLKEIKILIQGILENRVGDILHLVNICTATSLYVKKDHPFINNLSNKIGKLPVSMGADISFDLLLRFSSAANLGIEKFDSSALITKNLELDNNITFVKTNHLVELWSNNPLFFCTNQLSTYMFGDYLAKLISNDYQINDNVKEGILHQMIAYIPSFHSNEFFQVNKIFYVIAQLTLGLRVSHILNNFRIAKIFAKELDNIFLNIEVNKLIDCNTFTLNDFDNVCYIGINLFYLTSTSAETKKNCFELVTQVLENLKIDLTEDYRRIALKISALNFFLNDNQKYEISNEFNLGHNLYFFLALKRILIKSFEINYTLNLEVKKNNLDLENISIKDLWTCLQGFRYKTGWNDIQPPLLTLKRKEGDCKSIVSLFSLILLQTNYKVNICFYLGKYFKVSDENHVYIEISDLKKKVPFDITKNYGELNICVKNKNAIISYPLGLLIKSEENEILTDIISQIYMCKSLL